MTGIPGLFLLEMDSQQENQPQQQQPIATVEPQIAEQSQMDNLMTDAPAQQIESVHKDSDMVDVGTNDQPVTTEEVKQEVQTEVALVDVIEEGRSTDDMKANVSEEELSTDAMKVNVIEEELPTVAIKQEVASEEANGVVDEAKKEELPGKIIAEETEALEREPNAPVKEEKQDEEMGDTAEAEAEFEFTSDEESDSDDSSDESDSDVDPSDARDLAKRLMEELDEEDTGDAQPPKTLHELDESEVKVEIPDIKITSETRLEKLGSVQTTVENQVLIKAITDGGYRVLDEGSVLATEDNVVIGVVADVIGRVEAPLYTVRFNSIDEIQRFNLVFGKEIYYLPDHSTYVFTNPLMAQKGTDASNIYDEEVPESEQELSDDEAEAARKAAKKKGAVKRGKKQTGEPPKRQEKTRPQDRGVQLADDEPYIPLHRPSHLSNNPGQSHPNHASQQQIKQEGRQFSGNNQRNNSGWHGRNERGGNRNQRAAPYSPPSRPQSSNSYDDLYQPNRRPSYSSQPQPQQSYAQPQSPYQQQPPQYPSYPHFSTTGYSPLPLAISPGAYQPTAFTHAQLPPGSHINPAFFQQMQAAATSPAPQTPSYPFPQQQSPPQQHHRQQGGYTFNPYGQQQPQSPPQTPFQFGVAQQQQQGWGLQPGAVINTSASVQSPVVVQDGAQSPGGPNEEAFKKIQENLALLSSLGGVQ